MAFIDRCATTLLSLLVIILGMACQYSPDSVAQHTNTIVTTDTVSDVIVGAQRIAVYHPLLEGKKVAVVVNQTSRVGSSHLVDTLLSLGVDVVKIFAPEHGFRGEADAGQKVESGKDTKTGLPIVSLYGANKKPTQQQMLNVEVVLFDIQDVGARFYTYISTLHYIMEASAEAGVPVVVLDRPNPNAHYVDGPLLQPEFTSFVGMHPVPVVYGMTIGEYARMINGEEWLANGVKADLTVVECKNYTHNTFYELPVKPSPNLPNIRSILLYPSLCFFEGTTVSVGRGTDTQFQVIGHPAYEIGSYVFTPTSMPGAKYPKHEDQQCNGHSLVNATLGSLYDRKGLELTYLLNMYKELTRLQQPFFNDNNFFEKLAGTDQLRLQIISGMSEKDIKASWQPDIDAFMSTRAQYLIYD